jgi:hypothetical protein
MIVKLFCFLLSQACPDQVLPRRFNHFFGHHPYLVDLQNPLDLQKPPVNQTKIPSGSANNRCYERYMPSDIVLSPLYLFKRDQRLSSDKRTLQLACVGSAEVGMSAS